MTVVRTVTNSTRRANQFPILRNRVKPQNQKYFASQFGKSEVQLTHPVPIEGRIAIVTLRRPRDAVDAERQARLRSQGGMNPVSDYSVRDRRMTLLAYGEVVWSWRPLLALNRRRRCGLDRARKLNPPVTVTRRIRRRGEHEISRKAIAQGMSVCSPLPCMLVCAFLRTLAHETAGAARTRHSLRPLFERGATNLKASDANHAARTRTHAHSDVVSCEPRDPYAAADDWIQRSRRQLLTIDPRHGSLRRKGSSQ